MIVVICLLLRRSPGVAVQRGDFPFIGVRARARAWDWHHVEAPATARAVRSSTGVRSLDPSLSVQDDLAKVQAFHR